MEKGTHTGKLGQTYLAPIFQIIEFRKNRCQIRLTPIYRCASPKLRCGNLEFLSDLDLIRIG